MEKFKLYDVVRIIKDKDFICPAEHVKGSEGTIVEICEDKGTVGYIVEIDNDVFVFFGGRDRSRRLGGSHQGVSAARLVFVSLSTDCSRFL